MLAGLVVVFAFLLGGLLARRATPPKGMMYVDGVLVPRPWKFIGKADCPYCHRKAIVVMSPVSFEGEILCRLCGQVPGRIEGDRVVVDRHTFHVEK